MSKKKQIAELRAELEQLRSIVSGAESSRTEQTGRLDNLEVMIDGHDSTLDDTSEIVRQLPPPASIARIEQVEELGAATTASFGEVQNSLAEQQGAIAEQQSLIAAQATTIAEQRAVIESLRSQIRQVEEFTASETARMQARLAEIGDQLARQVDELGREVDAAVRRAEEAAQAAEAPVAALDEIRSAQARLAGEQVRYDLALRAELAELADRLRRNPRS